MGVRNEFSRFEAHLKRAILEIIASNVVQTKAELEKFVGCTLLCVERGSSFAYFGSEAPPDDDPIAVSIKFLLEFEFVRLQFSEELNEEVFVATKLGVACLSSSMAPSDGFHLFSELQKARQCFVLESDLHAIYLVTPFSVCYQLGDVDWLFFIDLWEKLPSAMRRVGQLVGIKDSFLIKAMRSKTGLDAKALHVHKRFFIALALQELVNEVPLNSVAAKFKCSRGLLQSLQQMASTFAGIVTSFCSALNWDLLALIVGQFRERLFFGIHRDLIDLMRIPSLSAQRARALFESGITNLQELAVADPFGLEKILFDCVSFDTDKVREGEAEHEADQRKGLRRVFITGKKGLTVNEAAKMLISDARSYLEQEMGVQNVQWARMEESEGEKEEENGEPAGKTAKNGAENGINELENRKKLENEAGKGGKTDEVGGNVDENIKIGTENGSKTFETVGESLNVEIHELSVDILEENLPEKSEKPSKVFKKDEEKPNSGFPRPTTPVAGPSKESGARKDELRSLNPSTFERNPKILAPKMSEICFDNAVTSTQISSPRKGQKRKNDDDSPNVVACSQDADRPSRLGSRSRTQKRRPSPSPSLEISSASETSLFHDSLLMNLSQSLDISTTHESLSIVNVCKHRKFFAAFEKELESASEVAVSVGLDDLQVTPLQTIGGNLLADHQRTLMGGELRKYVVGKCFVSGLAFVFDNQPPNHAFFLTLQDEDSDPLLTNSMKTGLIRRFFARKNATVVMYDAKEHLKVVSKGLGKALEVGVRVQDCLIADWLLNPDRPNNLGEIGRGCGERSRKLLDMAKAGESMRSLGLSHWGAEVDARIRCCVEACVVGESVKGQRRELQQKGKGYLWKSFTDLEMPIQVSLFKMEFVGLAIDFYALESLIERCQTLKKTLEGEIFKIHGSHFNLSSTTKVKEVLKSYLTRSGVKFDPSDLASTANKSLAKFNLPLTSHIMVWRKLDSALQRNLFPLAQNLPENAPRVHGNSFCCTETGRISMFEPNLQNTPKDFEVATSQGPEIVSCRKVFKVRPGRVLLVADFCQLELRILTHFSQDAHLLEIMKGDEDVFKIIAAKWYGIPKLEVSERQRNSAKQICYGIIYGMGKRAMAEALETGEDEAEALTEQFHATYPGIRNYTETIKASARSKGFIETLTGRRRFFPAISSDNTSSARAAERQAVNTTIQGSAADISKSAIIRMENNLLKYQEQLRVNSTPENQVDFVLHIHDELMYEIPATKVKKVAQILKHSMENCIKLSVPLRVKLKSGRSWGELSDLAI